MKLPQLNTRFTEMLGIWHPLLQGGMMYLSNADTVSAMVNAGGMGFITARSHATVDQFRAELRRCAALTGGRAFGVNLTLSPRMGFDNSIQSLLETALEEGVRFFETAGVLPDQIIGPIHAVGGKLIHKCPRIKHALTAQRLGVDGIVIVGMDEGGHPGKNELPSFTQAAYARDRITIPLAVGGGIGHGRQIAAALAMGMDAVCMGSRFMVATEIPAHEDYKRRLVEVDEDCSTTALASMNNTWRVLVNDNVRAVQKLEAEGVRSYEGFGELIRGYRTKEFAYDKGDWQQGMLSCSSAAGFADAIEPTADIVARLMRDTAAALGHAEELRRPKSQEQEQATV